MSSSLPDINKHKSDWRFTLGSAYLAVFVAGLPLSIAASDIAPAIPVLAGQALAIVVFLGTSALSLVLWLIYPSLGGLSRMGYAALISWVAVWVLLSSMNIADGQMIDYRTYLVPLLLLMLVVKPPSIPASELAAKALVAFTFFAIAISEIEALASERRSTLLDFSVRFLNISIGEPARWSGPFGNPNYAGPALALVAIYALTLRGSARVLIFSVSAILLLGTGSRSSWLGSLSGLAVYAIFSEGNRLASISRRTRAITLGTIGVILAVFLVYLDPTINGRTPIWSKHWTFWKEQPFAGVGTTNISQRMVPDPAFPLDIHAHNLFLDAGSRFGIVGLLLILFAMLMTFLAVWPAAVRGRSVGLALATAFTVIGIVEVHGSWQYWNMPWLWVILGVTLTSAHGRRSGIMKGHENRGPESAGFQSAGMRSTDGYRT